jgi:hypothetical protein
MKLLTSLVGLAVAVFVTSKSKVGKSHLKHKKSKGKAHYNPYPSDAIAYGYASNDQYLLQNAAVSNNKI